MPIFVIERQYLLPVYQHLVIAAPDLAAACNEAVEGDYDWEGAVEDGDGARPTTVSAAKLVPPDLAKDICAGHIHLGEFLHQQGDPRERCPDRSNPPDPARLPD